MTYPNLVKTCEEVWKVIQSTNVDVPEAFVIVGSGGRKAVNTYGHFAKERWEYEGKPIHEVLLVAEQLNRSATDVFTTLLHEAVHGIAETRGIKDVSGRSHNKKFAELCREVGMIPPEKRDARIGWSAATLSEDLRELYAPEIKKLEEAHMFYRKVTLMDKEVKKTSWSAECLCQRKIRIGRKAIEDMPDDLHIVCKHCDSPFELTEEYV
jgi:hypothetical protein